MSDMKNAMPKEPSNSDQVSESVTKEANSVEPEKEKSSRSDSENSLPIEDPPVEVSRWRKLVTKSATAAAAKKEAAALKLKQTQESIKSSKDTAAAAAIAKKEAAALKLKETGDSIKSSTNSASEKILDSGNMASTAVKSSSTNAAASVNAGFWNVVQIAKKVFFCVDQATMLRVQAPLIHSISPPKMCLYTKYNICS